MTSDCVFSCGELRADAPAAAVRYRCVLHPNLLCSQLLRCSGACPNGGADLNTRSHLLGRAQVKARRAPVLRRRASVCRCGSGMKSLPPVGAAAVPSQCCLSCCCALICCTAALLMLRHSKRLTCVGVWRAIQLAIDLHSSRRQRQCRACGTHLLSPCCGTICHAATVHFIEGPA